MQAITAAARRSRTAAARAAGRTARLSRCDGDATTMLLREALGAKKLKELRRQHNRLAELGRSPSRLRQRPRRSPRARDLPRPRGERLEGPIAAPRSPARWRRRLLPPRLRVAMAARGRMRDHHADAPATHGSRPASCCATGSRLLVQARGRRALREVVAGRPAHARTDAGISAPIRRRRARDSTACRDTR